MAYALINYSCFAASFAKSPGQHLLMLFSLTLSLSTLTFNPRLAASVQAVQQVGGTGGCGHLYGHHVHHPLVLRSRHTGHRGSALQAGGLPQARCVGMCVCVGVYVVRVCGECRCVCG